MSTLILYKTQWGSTRQYAEWIAEVAPDCTLRELDAFTPVELIAYDKIIIGSRTYMGHISAITFLVNAWEQLKEKPVYLFTVGILPPDDPGSQRSYEQIPIEIRNSLAGYIKLPGKIEVAKLNLFQKLTIEKLENIDKMDKSAIQPIVSFIAGS